MESLTSLVNLQDIVVFGAGGHAKVVIDIVEVRHPGSRIHLVDDDPAKNGAMVAGYCVTGTVDDLPLASCALLVAIGTNSARLAKASQLAGLGRPFLTAIHPAAIVARTAGTGPGTVVMAGVVVNSATSIGRHCILNTGCSIDHDCLLADGVHIGPGAVLCGTVRVGRGTLVGAGSTVLPNICIGAGVVIGAGTTVRNNVADNVVLCTSTSVRVLNR